MLREAPNMGCGETCISCLNPVVGSLPCQQAHQAGQTDINFRVAGELVGVRRDLKAVQAHTLG